MGFVLCGVHHYLEIRLIDQPLTLHLRALTTLTGFAEHLRQQGIMASEVQADCSQSNTSLREVIDWARSCLNMESSIRGDVNCAEPGFCQ